MDKDPPPCPLRETPLPSSFSSDASARANRFGAPGPASRVQRVMSRVVDKIRDEKLRVGDQLPSEVQLSKEFGFSRPVIREAFGALAALGVVDVGAGRRPRVAAVSSFPMTVAITHALNTGQVTFSQVWEIRTRLETAAAALAAERRTTEQAAYIMALSQEMAACDPNSPEMTRLDVDFHRSIAEASGNLLFEQIAASFQPLMMKAVPLAWSTRKTEADQADILERHRQVALAIANRDPAAAETAMRDHFDDSIAALLQGEKIDEPSGS